jgi:predicted HicB family RNase H-like nuclease
MPAAKKGKAKPAAKSSARKTTAAKKTPQAKKQAASAKRTNTMRSGSAHAEDYSGKFTVRLPRSLHEALVDRAEQEGVSLNLFVTNALSRTVGSIKGKK